MTLRSSVQYSQQKAGFEKKREETQQLYLSPSTMAALPPVLPVVTPRFIPTCSQPLLKALGELAVEFDGCHTTSHISESYDEVEFICLLDVQNHQAKML